MKATARIHPNDEVTLHLNLEISSLGAQSVNGIPIISNQSVEQTIRLRDNETTMVMGIRQPEVTNTLNGWPYVSSVPGVGLLTSDQGKTDQDSDIIVMITPRLVDFSPRKDRLIYAGRGTAKAREDRSVAGAESIAAFQSSCHSRRSSHHSPRLRLCRNRFPRRNQTRILKMKRRRSLRHNLNCQRARNTKRARRSSSAMTPLPARRVADTSEEPRARQSRSVAPVD